jgi:hypothetical protein
MNDDCKSKFLLIHFAPRLYINYLILLILCVNADALSNVPILQSDLESRVKAAYINNFTKFIYWKSPEQGSTKNQIVIGVYGSDPVGEILEDYSQKQKDGQSIIVKNVSKKPAELASCNLLFIAQSEQQQLAQILKQIEGTNILTVSDIAGFVKKGGMIGFFIDQNKIRIEINLRTTNRAGLKISAKLLEVARVVDGDD